MRRILSIDGGGIKGVFPAWFLATVEESLGDRISDYFDLIVGTSTGGIIAIGLGLGLRAQEILELYQEHAAAVFPQRRGPALVNWFLGPKYKPSSLRTVLEEKFADRRLGESRVRLVIPSVNLDTGQVYIYKTAHHERFELDFRSPVVDVAMATAAAPAYFPAHLTPSGTALIDGGVWANNPTGMGVVEAIGVLGWDKSEVDVLSLGCTTTPLNLGPRALRRMGLGYWATRVMDIFFAAQSSASMGTAYTLIGHDRVYRVSPYVAPGRFRLDDVREIPALCGLGQSEARNALPNLRLRFLTERAQPFQPCHKLTT